jgi:hypothetical protein
VAFLHDTVRVAPETVREMVSYSKLRQ